MIYQYIIQDMRNWFINNKHLTLIILLAIGLRFTIINQSLWLDEAIGALAVRDYSFFGIITDFIKADNHPPLYYLTLKLWTNLFGYSELALRSLSVLFGAGTVWLTYAIAKSLKIKNKAYPIIAALLISTSQFHVYYSQEARMYSMAAFFAALSFLSFINTAIKKDKLEKKWWFIFSLSTTAMVFTDYVPIFLLPVFWIAGFYNKKKYLWWKNFLISHVPMLVLAIFWFPTFMVQAKHGSWLVSVLPSWKLVAGGANLKQAILVWMKFVFGRLSLANKAAYYLLVVISSIPIVYLLIKSLKDIRKVTIVWLWLMVPLLTGFLTSFLFPAFIYFRFLYVLPAFYLLVAYGVVLTKRSNLRSLLIIALIVVNMVALGIYYFDQHQQREQWKQAVKLIERNAKDDEIVIFGYPKPFSPYRWYESGRVVAVGVTNSISADSIMTRELTLESTIDINGVYYFEYLRDLVDPNRLVEKTLVEKGYEVKNVINFVGVGQVFYYKK